MTLAVSVTSLYAADRIWGHHGARAVDQQLAQLDQERSALKNLSRSLKAERVQMQDYRRALAMHTEHSAPVASRVARRPPASAAADAEVDARLDPATPSPASEPPPTMEQLSENLQDTFEEHGDDPAWSRGAEQQIREGFYSSIDGRTSLSSVHCNSTMCRIESDHDDMASFQTFAEGTVLNPGNGLWNGAIFTAVVDGEDDDRSVTALTFIAREGEPLPGVAS